MPPAPSSDRLGIRPSCRPTSRRAAVVSDDQRRPLADRRFEKPVGVRRLRQQRLDLAPQRSSPPHASARNAGALACVARQRRVIQLLDPPPALRRQSCALRRRSSRSSQSFASRQSRMTCRATPAAPRPSPRRSTRRRTAARRRGSSARRLPPAPQRIVERDEIRRPVRPTRASPRRTSPVRRRRRASGSRARARDPRGCAASAAPPSRGNARGPASAPARRRPAEIRLVDERRGLQGVPARSPAM